jgi:hypothetical protein
MNQKQTGGWLMSPRRSPSRTKNPSPTSKKRSQLQNQSQSQSQSQSQKGGRRRKSTMRKLRRGRKSRKVMRGGATYREVSDVKTLFQGNDELKQKLFQATNTGSFEDIMNVNNGLFNTSSIAFDIENKRGKEAYAELTTFLRSK